MYRNHLLCLAASLVLLTPLLAGCTFTQPAGQQIPEPPAVLAAQPLAPDFFAPPACGDPDFRHCTILTVSQGDRVFFGGNDDYVNRDSYYWVDPGGASDYGAIYFGRPDNVQQGFNEKGLAYDANGLPEVPVKTHPGRKPVYGGYSSYPIQILQGCATVEEVISWVQEHRWHEVMWDQLHFADATGDAVVISAGPDGRVAFTRKPAGDGFLLSTNFNLANPNNGSYPCWRYSRAQELLGQIESPAELTAERVASIMDAVHVETPNGWTLYSVVADLPQRLVYVYFWFQYDAPIVLNVDEEISRAPDPGPLSALFPPETVSRAEQAYQRLTQGAGPCSTAALGWGGLVVLSLAALLLLRPPGRRALQLWIPTVALLGPVGLLARWAAGRSSRAQARVEGAKPPPRLWQRALVETVGDLPPYVLGMVISLFAVLLVPELGQNRLLQFLSFYGIPLVLALFLYQSPLLSGVTANGYGRTLLNRLPAALVSTNLAMAGLLSVNLPAATWYLNTCPLGGSSVLSFWASAVLGALAGGLLLFAHHTWAIRRGHTAWSALLWKGPQTSASGAPVPAPSWRDLWLWVLLSTLLLITGIALGAVVTMLISGAG